MIGIAAFALLLAGYALIANRLDRLSIGPALAFVVVGVRPRAGRPRTCSTVDVETTTVRHLAEITLALVLFTDASTVDLPGSGATRRLIGSPARDRPAPDDRSREGSPAR